MNRLRLLTDMWVMADRYVQMYETQCAESQCPDTSKALLSTEMRNLVEHVGNVASEQLVVLLDIARAVLAGYTVIANGTEVLYPTISGTSVVRLVALRIFLDREHVGADSSMFRVRGNGRMLVGSEASEHMYFMAHMGDRPLYPELPYDVEEDERPDATHWSEGRDKGLLLSICSPSMYRVGKKMVYMAPFFVRVEHHKIITPLIDKMMGVGDNNRYQYGEQIYATKTVVKKGNKPLFLAKDMVPEEWSWWAPEIGSGVELGGMKAPNGHYCKFKVTRGPDGRLIMHYMYQKKWSTPGWEEVKYAPVSHRYKIGNKVVLFYVDRKGVAQVAVKSAKLLVKELVEEVLHRVNTRNVLSWRPVKTKGGKYFVDVVVKVPECVNFAHNWYNAIQFRLKGGRAKALYQGALRNK